MSPRLLDRARLQVSRNLAGSERSPWVVLDCDGTLLRPDGSLGERTCRVIARAQQAGWHVTLATGRRYSTALAIIERLQLQEELVLQNGAVVAQANTGGILRYQGVRPEPLAQIIPLARRYEIDMMLFDDPRRRDGGLIEALPRNPLDRRYVLENGDLFQKVPDLAEALPDWPLKMIFTAEPDRMKHFVPILKQAIQPWPDVRMVVYGGPTRPVWSVEILHQQASKAAGVSWVVSRHQASLEQVIAFGDEMNDYELISAAGWGVAMQNGVSELQRVAREIAPPNSQEGVATVLERLLEEGGEKELAE